MSEHVCEKKTKSALLSESSCSVLSEISGSETKQHSFHTELSPWQQIFLDWGNKGLCNAEVRAVLAVLAGLGAPREELMGAVCSSICPGRRGCQHQPAQCCGDTEALMSSSSARQQPGFAHAGSRSGGPELLMPEFSYRDVSLPKPCAQGKPWKQLGESR